MKQVFCHLKARKALTILVSAGSLVLVTAQSAMAQQWPTAMRYANSLPLDSVAVKPMAALDLHAIAMEDVANQSKDNAPRFAISNPTHITPDTDGTWEKVDANTLLWRLRVTCPNAVSINFGFTRFNMPEGGQLYLYNAAQSDFVRPFTALDGHDDHQLWTPPVMSNDVIIEVTIPETKRRQLDLELGSINLGYVDFTAENNALKAAGDEGGIATTGGCEIDVICPQGDPWRNEIQAVARITIGGSVLCSGWMTNNTAQDKKNYFMTANHCGLTSGNAGTMVAFFNYFNSTCRPTSGCGDGCVPPGNGSFSQFISGSTFRASFATSDFTLAELSGSPPAAWQISYAGWNHDTSTNFPVPTARAFTIPLAMKSASACMWRRFRSPPTAAARSPAMAHTFESFGIRVSPRVVRPARQCLIPTIA